jgi:hypothetical protein
MRRSPGLPPRALIALLLVLPLLTVAAPRVPIAAAQPAAAPLELPAMVLDPNALDQSGTPGYAWLSGETIGPEALAGIAGDLTDQIVNDEIQASLEQSGLRQGYSFGMRLLQNPADPESELARDIYGALHEFTTEAGAAEALAFIAALTTADPEITRAEGTGTLGPNAVYFRTVSGEGEDIVHALKTIFQAGPLMGYINLVVYADQEPAIEEIEALATLQQQRVQDAIQTGTLGLGHKVPRITNPEFGNFFEIRRDEYLRRDGIDIRQAFDEPADAERRAALAGNATDMYALQQFVDNATEFEPSWAEQFGIVIHVYRFNDDTAASTWLADRPNQIEADYAGSDIAVQDIQVVTDAQTYGDESLMLSYIEVSDFGGPVDRVFIRVANTVADLRFAPLGEMPRSATEALAALQARCLVDTCPEPLTITEALLGQPPAETPAAETPAPGLTPTAGQTPAPETTPTAGIPATPPVTGQQMLDLAAITLTPADLDDLGLEGFGMSYGQTAFLEELIVASAEFRNLPEAEVRAAYEANGLIRRYDLSLHQPLDPADPAGDAGRLVVSYVMEFADAAGAAAAWAFSEDESFAPASTDEPLTTPLGEQSEATRESGTDADGLPFAQIDLTFQSGNLHAGLVIIDWTGAEPDLAQAEALAARLMERIESVRAGNAPGLSSMAVRLTGENVAPYADDYILLDGQIVRAYGQSQQDAILQTYVSAVDRETDSFRMQQQLTAGTDAPEDDGWLFVNLTRFADEATAQAWLAGTQQRLTTNPDFANFQIAPGPTLADESITYTVSGADGQYQYRGATMRAGTIVVTIDVAAPTAPDPAAVDAILAHQAACLTQGGCDGPLAVPPALESP